MNGVLVLRSLHGCMRQVLFRSHCFTACFLLLKIDGIVFHNDRQQRGLDAQCVPLPSWKHNESTTKLE